MSTSDENAEIAQPAAESQTTPRVETTEYEETISHTIAPARL